MAFPDPFEFAEASGNKKKEMQASAKAEDVLAKALAELEMNETSSSSALDAPEHLPSETGVLASGHMGHKKGHKYEGKHGGKHGGKHDEMRWRSRASGYAEGKYDNRTKYSRLGDYDYEDDDENSDEDDAWSFAKSATPTRSTFASGKLPADTERRLRAAIEKHRPEIDAYFAQVKASGRMNERSESSDSKQAMDKFLFGSSGEPSSRGRMNERSDRMARSNFARGEYARAKASAIARPSSRVTSRASPRASSRAEIGLSAAELFKDAR